MRRSAAPAQFLMLSACSNHAAAKAHVISWRDHQQLRPGMPYAEVVQILGQPGVPSIEYDPQRRALHHMTFDSPSGVFMVQFEAGRVVKVYPGALRPPPAHELRP